jgi:hypothetical protein
VCQELSTAKIVIARSARARRLQHEIGHAVYQTVLTPAQRELVLDAYVTYLDALGPFPPVEPREHGIEHYFISSFLPAVLGQGNRSRGAAESRRAMANFGIHLRDR